MKTYLFQQSAFGTRLLSLLFCAVITAVSSVRIIAQTKVIAVENGRQKVIDLDSVYLAKGQVDFFEGTETGTILVNVDNRHYLKIWIAPDTIELNNGAVSHILFVYQDTLGIGTQLTNEWYEYGQSDFPQKPDNKLGITKIDSSNIMVGGLPYMEYTEYWAVSKYKLGERDSAGLRRKVILNGYYDGNNPTWPTTIPWQEKRRWRKAL